MNLRFARIVPLIMIIAAAGLPAQSGEFDNWTGAEGDPAIAEKYLLWAEDAIESGRWPQARAALERAADFADVSSDISYLLALARSHENERRGIVLQALEKAIATGKWTRYTEAQARLMEAEQLIIVRRYTSALNSLAAYRAVAGEDADSAVLRLRALKGLAGASADLENAAKSNKPAAGALPFPAEFRRRMLETMDRYPRDPRPLRILFNYVLGLQSTGKHPGNDDRTLMELALKRLPFLLEQDPELAWMAAAFISDVVAARRLVSAYRAGALQTRPPRDFKPNPASIVPALNLGLIDGNAAIDELFSETVLDKDLIITIDKLLRDEKGREYLAEKLHGFTGAITEDADYDGYAESRAVYYQGALQEYYVDADQDGVVGLFVMCNAGDPQYAELTVLSSQETQVSIYWERYPSVQKAVMATETWLPAPGAFQFAPIDFIELGLAERYAGLLFPRRDPRSQGINRRILASFSNIIQRPSVEFKGGTEQVQLRQGIPVRSEITLNGMLVSVTEFENGSPVIQRLDMNTDGHIDTVRHFRSGSQTASTAHANDVFSSAERYRKDGSVVYSWDLDGDGTLEYSETRY